MAWLRRYLSGDDLVSAVGYLLFTVGASVLNPDLQLAAGSFLASGMLAIFWLASTSVRERNADRNPNARVVVWALVAAVSAAVFAL